MRVSRLFICLTALAAACSSKPQDALWLANGPVTPKGKPYYALRILDHWDNLDDSVERGYAGKSIWSWTSSEIPEERIRTYGRLNQSIGINGSVLNNVNAAPQILDAAHLRRVAQIADILRDYGIKTYLSVNFASPMALKEVETADPLDAKVVRWWTEKVNEIYSLIPDFGGFLVKASSEGQPGPQDFGRSHADGANMLADALKPHGGIVMWRAFVYAPNSPDRAKQAVEEFVPLDGRFRDNVIVQIKNGPVDFQPCEPFSPLFGGLYKTKMMPELQITQEYLGQSKHLVFLAPMWEEFFRSDTYRDGAGSTIPLVTSAIAGVANTGQDDDWCGHLFSQANWYAFGRLAWDPTLTSEQIADEWLHLTFEKPRWCSRKRFETRFIEPVKKMMLASHEACVDYMMPLGLHHIFSANHHYGPGPADDWPGARKDWLPKYYHQAGTDGVGFDRTRTGTDAVDQYHEPLASEFNDLKTCPEKYLLWFHHVPWTYSMSDGKTLWDDMKAHYDKGVAEVDGFDAVWDSVKPYVDDERWQAVKAKLQEQKANARLWRDTCIGYFGQYAEAK